MLQVTELEFLDHISDVQNYASAYASERDNGNKLAWVLSGGSCVGTIIGEIHGYNSNCKTYHINTNLLK